MNVEDDDDDAPEIEIEFFPLPLEAEKFETDEEGNFHLQIRMDDEQMDDFVQRVKQFNKLKEAQEKGETIEFLDSDDQEPYATDYLE